MSPKKRSAQKESDRPAAVASPTSSPEQKRHSIIEDGWWGSRFASAPVPASSLSLCNMEFTSGQPCSLASLSGIPTELLQQVLSFQFLSSQDIKSVRLACHRLADKAAGILFYRIRMSSLVADRDAFLHIANSAHLAHHVRVLVWEELGGDHETLLPQAWVGVLREEALLEDLMPQMRALFWLVCDSAMNYDASIASFLPRFNAAIDAMPNFHTLISRPMHPFRLLQPTSSGYPLTAQVIQRFLHSEQPRGGFSIGFTAFWLPTLRHLSDHPDRHVTSLFFADETVSANTALLLLTPEDAAAFSRLEHLDICIGGACTRDLMMDGFVACLTAAVNLRHFHLCLERALAEYEYSGSTVFDNPMSLIPYLPRLTELHLEDFPLDDDLQVSTFVDIVKRHAATLRKLNITTANITLELLTRLARLESLNLERFVIMPEVEEDEGFPISEEEILRFVNRNTLSDQPRKARGYLLDVVRTHHGIWDLQGWMTAAVLDSRQPGWSRRGYEPWELHALDNEAGEWRDEDGWTHEIGPGRVCDLATGLWRDTGGIWYDPRTDKEILDPERRSYESDDKWVIQGERIWDWDLGLWRDMCDGAEGRLYKFAVDWHDVDGTGDTGLEGDTKSSDPYGLDEQHLYDREDAAHVLRPRRSPKWQWGRDSSGDVWYWAVQGNHIFGWPTELWRFVHRDGDEAFGDDPLEFWSDWEGSEAGDVAEPTPYGWRLRTHVKMWPRDGWDASEGADLPVGDEFCTSLVKYHEPDDPMIDVDVRENLAIPADFKVDEIQICVDDCSPIP